MVVKMRQHITPTFRDDLHWLLVRQRLDLKEEKDIYLAQTV